MDENNQKIITDRAYIKLIKNSKNVNWEIKMYEDTDDQTMIELRSKINKMHSEMTNDFAGEI